MSTKRCPRCGAWKSPQEFSPDRSKASGLKSWCRACDRAWGKAIYRKHKAAMNETRKRRSKAKREAERAIRGPKPCVQCGAPAPSYRHRYCPSCRPTNERKRPTRERGYGVEHQRERERLRPVVESGGAFCARCGWPIEPGEPWHLDHTDDRTGYLGPSHPSCNIKAARA